MVTNEFISFQAFTFEHILKTFIDQNLKEKHLVVIFPSSKAFKEYPHLNLLKRDNYTLYLSALEEDIVIFEFKTFEEAKDYYWSFRYLKDINIWLYSDKQYWQISETYNVFKDKQNG